MNGLIICLKFFYIQVLKWRITWARMLHAIKQFWLKYMVSYAFIVVKNFTFCFFTDLHVEAV